MCGIFAFISDDIKAGRVEAAHLQAALEHMRHRGPDDQGVKMFKKEGLALGFRRLAVQELSKKGAQPMVSASKRYTLVFNGEIYNFPELKDKLALKGHTFKGGSDTEVMLAAFDEWGVDAALPMFNGMFAFALYDQDNKTLTLARDPLGKKPLYLGWHAEGFFASSELKPVLSLSKEPPVINPDVAALYFQWRYVPDPYSIYRNIWKMKPGTSLTLKISEAAQVINPTSRMVPYWSLRKVIAEAEPFQGSEEEALNRLDLILRDAVERRMTADVPLGAFLSGGVDSALVTAIMQKHSSTPVKSLTIGFDDPAYNEAEYARAIARHVGTEHREMTLGVHDAMQTAPRIAGLFDEPFGDPSAIPAYHVSKLAREDMTVALSGDGGDENFGGYGWYARAARLNLLPALARNPLGQLLGKVALKPQVRKLASIMAAPDPAQQYKALHSYWQTENLQLTPAEVLPLPMDIMPPDYKAYDSVMFLPGDVLVKVDRMSMANSLEVRSPLLDQNVVEFVWSLPTEMRTEKRLLKRLLKRYVPTDLTNRPKQGFSIPHGAWLRGPLGVWAQEMLRLDQDLLDKARLMEIWHAHERGQDDYGHLLWTVIMYQSWREASR